VIYIINEYFLNDGVCGKWEDVYENGKPK